MRYWASQVLAYSIYWPFARVAYVLNKLRICPDAWPLKYYHDKPMYVLRTDALDRFGTRLEQRFSRKQVSVMMENSGLANIKFSEKAPFWCAVGIKVK